MRGIVNREHRKALAERREARQSQEAARAIEPTNTSWSTKAPRARRAAGAARDLAERIDQRRDEWKRRYPDVAREERRLRKANANAQREFGKKHDGTPQTHAHVARRREGAMRRLWLSGAIDADQLAASIEIAGVAERIGADVSVRTASLETRIDGGRLGDGTFYESLSRVRHEMAYTRWRSELGRDAPMVLDVITCDVGIAEASRAHRCGARRAKKLLIDALDRWREVLLETVKRVDRTDVAIAHAAIA